TSGLDPMTSRFVIEYIKGLRRRGKTVVFSAHNLYQVEEICDAVMILRRGKAVACGSMDELRERFGSVTYWIHFRIDDASRLDPALEAAGSNGQWTATARETRDLNRIVGAIAASGGTIERIESRYPTLEEMLVRIGN
ncbi:MAG: DUF4162 domain-containing protein, partial [Methanomicrobiaceae archaeon]|nr:DUF4162 domain-containing protein [Methanomicrobiaceae archaeon]